MVIGLHMDPVPVCFLKQFGCCGGRDWISVQHFLSEAVINLSTVIGKDIRSFPLQLQFRSNRQHC